MISSALTTWRGTRSARLDRLVQTRLMVNWSARWAADELDQALVLRVASEFQGFARDLHDEAIELIGEAVAPGDRHRQLLLGLPYQAARRLDPGNTDVRALSQDFKLFGLTLWSDLEQGDPSQAAGWKAAVEALNTARNGLAHDDAAKIQASERAGWPVSLASVQRWRESLDGLVAAMDHVVGTHLTAKFATAPWKGL